MKSAIKNKALNKASSSAKILISNFSEDKQGNVALIFGLSLMVLLGAVGIAIDYSRATIVKSRLQAGTDAAVLNVSQAYANNPQMSQTDIATALQNFLAGSTVDPNAQIDYNPSVNPNGSNSTPGVSVINNQLCVTTKSLSPRTLTKLIGAQDSVVHASACTAIPTGKVLEIAMALDNTGSMAEMPTGGGTTKMQALQQAALQVVSTINANPNNPRAAISVVPFASSVNIGTQYQSANFMDVNGQSSIHWQNYSKPPSGGAAPNNSFNPTSRFDVFGAMNASWGGCVEERPVPYLTTDAPANAANPDSLHVPFLAPDDPGPATGAATYTYGNGQQGNSYNSYLDDNGGYCASDPTLNNKFIAADQSVPAPEPQGTGGTKLCKYKNQAVASVNTNVSGLNGGTGLFPAGPNFGCSTAPLQILTTDNSAVNAKINAMTPNGDTNLVSGFMWGWRTISPNGPFGGQSNSTIGPQNPVPYTNTSVKKIIIFMTDGFDHWVDNAGSAYGSAYSSLGYYVNGRVSSYGNSTGSTNVNNYRAQMDAALLDGCANAKSAGVTIYTVGFSVSSNPIDAQGINTLQSCATNANSAFIATNSAEIVDVFKQIAIQISKLRLSK